MKKIMTFSFALIIVDQLVKFLVSSSIMLNNSVSVTSFFKLTYTRNYGAAFGILEGSRIFLVIVAISAIMAIYMFFIRKTNLTKYDIVSYSLLIGGIIGNLFDRIVHGYVIDFFEFSTKTFTFPIFNMADIFINVAVGLILLKMVREKDGEVNSR